MSQENKERYEELLVGYILGTLSRVELDEFQRLRDEGLPGDAMTIEEARELLAELPSAIKSPKPSPKVKEQLMAQITAAPRKTARTGVETRYWTTEIPPLAWAAILVLALINLGMFTQMLRLYSDFGKLADQNAKLKSGFSQLAAKSEDSGDLKSNLARVQKELEHQKTLNAMLTDPDVRVAHMKATKSDCVARLYAHPAERLVIVCTQSLPKLEPGQDYQLWALLDGKPVSVGLLGMPDKGVYKVKVSPTVPMDKNSTFAISLEPKGGNEQPTGEIVFASL